MKKRLIGLSSIAVAALLTFNACGSTARYDRDSTNESGISNQPSTGLVTDNPATFVPIETPTTGSIADTNQTDTNGTTEIKTINGTYSIKFTPEFDSMTSGQTQNVHYEITNFFTKKPADNSVVNYLKFEIDDKYAEFFDSEGRHGDTIEFKNGAESTGDIAIKSSSLSGQVRMNFHALIDNTDINLTKSFPITIEKNKSSSMAIVPYESTYDKGLFIDKFVIHVVDSYGNKAKDGTRISTGVINNPKLYSNAYDINTGLYKDDKGELKRSENKFIINTTSSLVSPLDTLITLANKDEHKPVNLGGWDISDVQVNGSAVVLYDFDSGTDVTGVSYVIGDEYRYDQCNKTIMNAASSSFESTEVKDGVAYAELRYVPAMVGKTIFIYANSRLDDKQIGISRRVALTGTGLVPVSVSCTNEKGEQPTCTKVINLTQSNSLKFAREASLAYPINTGDAESAHLIMSDKTNCSGNIEVTISNIDVNKTATYEFGTIAIERILNQN